MFIFKSYLYDHLSKSAHFRYQNNGIDFEEIVTFPEAITDYNQEALDRALFLAFMLVGTSYYKTFPSEKVEISEGGLDEWQVGFFEQVYQEGLSQFAYENNLTRDDLALFEATRESEEPAEYHASDTSPLVLQSGGKDSLLLAELLNKKNQSFTPWYISSVEAHPKVLDSLSSPLLRTKRQLDTEGLQKASTSGGLNGHVPVTYIVLSLALIQSILLGKDTVLAAIGNEGEEPHEVIGDLEVRHQWAKTWRAEQMFSQYVQEYISPEIKVGSPLRKYSELKIAKMFVENTWDKYLKDFSSCNVANYVQGQNNQKLGWCGNCPKCANSFLLFAPFVEPGELSSVFNGENLFKKESLHETFKGLLGIDGIMKPFECVGEIEELRLAYHLAHERSSEFVLPFEVPDSNYEYNEEHEAQEWAVNLI